MPRRFFASLDASAEQFELSGTEAHHLLRVLRMRAGEQVLLFDGTGQEVLAEILSTEGETARLKVLQRRTATNESAVPLTIATAVPKGDRFSWLIEKLTELGVHRVIPLIAKRSIVDPGSGKLEKLRRTIIEASKQCGRSRLMELTEPQSWSAFLAQEIPRHTAFMAHPSGEQLNWRELGKAEAFPEDRRPMFLIGPEGGFTDTEVEQAVDQGAKLVQLGPRILRIETAALAVAALAGLQISQD